MATEGRARLVISKVVFVGVWIGIAMWR